MPYSTTAIFGKRAASLVSAQDYIDWAGDLLVQGEDSYHLRILSALDKHTGSYEAEDYFLRCVKELALTTPDSVTALLAYASEIAKKVVDDDIAVEQGIGMLYRLCVAFEYDPDFIIWLELDDALDDLLAGSEPYAYPTATLANIGSIAKDEAQKFIDVMADRMMA